MPDSLCPLTIAVCTADAHCAVDLELPADVHIGQLLPQIVDIVYRGTAPDTGYDWRLTRLGDLAMDEGMTLTDNDVRAGEVLLLTTFEPPDAEWVDWDPCRTMATARTAVGAPVLRILPAICCVLLGGFGALALVLVSPRTTGLIVTGMCLAVAAAAGAAVFQRVYGDPLICVPLSLIAVLYAGAAGFLAVPPGPGASGLLLASAVMLFATTLVLRVTGCGRACLTAVATGCAVTAATAAAGVTWGLQLNAGGATLATLSLATLAYAPRLSMILSGTTPSAPNVDVCHRTLTGLVVGSSISAAVGAASVAIGSGLRGTAFAAIVALVLLLRVRTHEDPIRRIGLAAAGLLAVAAGFVTVTIADPSQTPAISALATISGVAGLGCLVRPTVSPIAQRAVEVVEYLALAAVVPLACWVGGIYAWAREVNLV